MSERTLVRCTGAGFGMTYNGMAIGLVLSFEMEPDGSISWTTPCLDTFDHDKNRRVGTAYGLDFLLQLLDVLGVEMVSELKGRYFYVLSADPTGWGRSSESWTGFERLGMDGGKRLVFADVAAEWGLSP